MIQPFDAPPLISSLVRRKDERKTHRIESIIEPGTPFGRATTEEREIKTGLQGEERGGVGVLDEHRCCEKMIKEVLPRRHLILFLSARERYQRAKRCVLFSFALYFPLLATAVDERLARSGEKREVCV